MKYIIETKINGIPILGSDCVTFVETKTGINGRKMKNAIKKHHNYLKTLLKIKPYLSNGYELAISEFGKLNNIYSL